MITRTVALAALAATTHSFHPLPRLAVRRGMGLGRTARAAGRPAEEVTALGETERAALAGADDVQAALMEEALVLVDANDTPTGKASKARSHMIEFGLELHRAFSVFHFDAQGRSVVVRPPHIDKTTARSHTPPHAGSCCSAAPGPR